MAGVELRGALSAPGLLREARKSFERIPAELPGEAVKLIQYRNSGLIAAPALCTVAVPACGLRARRIPNP